MCPLVMLRCCAAPPGCIRRNRDRTCARTFLRRSPALGSGGGAYSSLVNSSNSEFATACVGALCAVPVALVDSVQVPSLNELCHGECVANLGR